MTGLTENVSQLCRDLDRTVDQYREELARKAEAESEFKRERAKRILRARADGEKAVSGAEIIADADDLIADLRLKSLIAEGIATLKERIGWGRSLYATQRETDRLHSQNPGVA